jgi:hypothetical protein
LGSYTMNSPELHSVAQSVLSRARRQGYILPREIRMELKEAGQSTTLWKQVVNLIGPSLKYRNGRYYAQSSLTQLQREQNNLKHIRETLQEFLQKYQTPKSSDERRKEDRACYLRSVKIQTEDQQELTVLCQDLSLSGIRLVTERCLLGRKVRLYLPGPQGPDYPIIIAMRIVWSQSIADGLYKSGGTFLELISQEPSLVCHNNN